MSREKTVDEVREDFLQHIRTLVNYWDEVGEPDAPKTQKERLAGLAFSIMVTLDGGAGNLPGFVVAPISAEGDKEWYIQQGEDYYADLDEDSIKCDIAGYLHELLKI